MFGMDLLCRLGFGISRSVATVSLALFRELKREKKDDIALGW